MTDNECWVVVDGEMCRKPIEAHTPTDGEWEALAKLIDSERRGWRRPGSGDSYALADVVLTHLRRTVSDAHSSSVSVSDDFDAADAAFKKRDERATWGDAEDRDAAVRWHWRGFQDGAESVRRTVQGEPTDAEVWAAQRALSRHGYITSEDIRAALRAAAATQEGEHRG